MENLVLKTMGALALLLLAGSCLAIPEEVKKLPLAEQEMANDVDPWGLAFADQLRVFREKFAQAVESCPGPADYVLGWENGLTKVFKPKYWFRGSFECEAWLTCARGEHENIQIAVIPNVGKELKGVRIAAGDLKCGNLTIPSSAIDIYRVGFVKTVSPPYPVVHVGYWPDPLLPNAPIDVTGPDLGLFWVDVGVPRDAKPGNYVATLTVSCDSSAKREFTLNVEVLPFELPKRGIPMVVWTQPKNPWGDMTPQEYEALAMMYLDHGIDAVKVWSQLTDAAKPESGDALAQRLLDAGLLLLDIPRDWLGRPEMMKHVQEKKWMDRAIVYGAQDEPLLSVFEEKVVPDTKRIRAMTPAPRVYLASDYHPAIDRGADIWMTDLSTGKGLPFALQNKGNAELWVYYCHLPINIALDRPIPDAPNMLIDNPAVEHRLAYWIAWKYGIPGMFIWAGNHGWDGANKPNWTSKEWVLTTEKAGYPYAGIHNGNGYLIYPGPNPSIRMKVIRDGVEDYAYLVLLKSNLDKLSGADRTQAEEILAVPKDVLVNTHYFNRDPKGVLETRSRIAAILAKLK